MSESVPVAQKQSLSPDSTLANLPVDSTETSHFADSAIDMSKMNLNPVPESEDQFATPPPIVSVSERLEQLTTAVWEAEQENKLSKSWTEQLHLDLDKFERNLDNEEGFEEQRQVPQFPPTDATSSSAEPAHDEQLKDVLIHLADTISSIRLRQQEQRHLHQLSRTKLEAVVHRCLVQEEQLRDLKESTGNLRQENRILGAENDVLRNRVESLEDEVTRREVAVDAMTSAVAGLQGWIEDPRHNVDDHTPSSGVRRTPRRAVIRGRGRFRGKYYVDEVEGSGSRYKVDGGSDAKDLHDGVKAWLRGFKDVEEEARSTRSDRTKTSKEIVEDSTATDEDWGAFEIAS